jgi:branched-chain amino acid transport system permease protein
VIPFTILWELIAARFPGQTILLLGIAFLLIVYLIPNGVVGRIESALRATGRKTSHA